MVNTSRSITRTRGQSCDNPFFMNIRQRVVNKLRRIIHPSGTGCFNCSVIKWYIPQCDVTYQPSTRSIIQRVRRSWSLSILRKISCSLHSANCLPRAPSLYLDYTGPPYLPSKDVITMPSRILNPPIISPYHTSSVVHPPGILFLPLTLLIQSTTPSTLSPSIPLCTAIQSSILPASTSPSILHH